MKLSVGKLPIVLGRGGQLIRVLRVKSPGGERNMNKTTSSGAYLATTRETRP